MCAFNFSLSILIEDVKTLCYATIGQNYINLLKPLLSEPLVKNWFSHQVIYVEWFGMRSLGIVLSRRSVEVLVRFGKIETSMVTRSNKQVSWIGVL